MDGAPWRMRPWWQRRWGQPEATQGTPYTPQPAKLGSPLAEQELLGGEECLSQEPLRLTRRPHQCPTQARSGELSTSWHAQSHCESAPAWSRREPTKALIETAWG